MFSIKVLERLRLRLMPTRAERFTKLREQVDGQLIEATESLNVELFGMRHDCPHILRWVFVSEGATGVYFPIEDMIGLNFDNFRRESHDVNGVLAHELIHSTGRPTRLNRLKINPTFEQIKSEEVIAQYGAMILMRKLGIASKTIDAETERYLKKFGRPDGLPSHAEAVQAIRAVKYVLQSLETFQGGENHAETSAGREAA